MKNKKIIIAGGTGFIGQALVRYFGKDNCIVILTRTVSDHKSNNYDHHLLDEQDGFNVKYIKWDGRTAEDHWVKECEASDMIINLAGRSVNCRYTKKNMDEILSSRIDATRALGEAVRKTIVPPKLWINAASATIYANTKDKPNDEYTGRISDLKKDNMPSNFLHDLRWSIKKTCEALFHGKNSDSYKALEKDFSVMVCKEWERCFDEQRTPFTRKICLRTAVTLGEAGVVVPYLNLLKYGLGGQQGDGTQMYSWLHVEDLARTIEWVFDHPDMEGVYNCAAPHAVTNDTFMSIFRKVTAHRFGLPAFAWMLELGAKFIGTETELILKSRWVVPAKLSESGFVFKYPALEDALKEIVSKTKRSKYHLF
jgi:NAD dependent epimerase/dehydratase family enzyme